MGVRADDASPREVARDFRALLEGGARIVAPGEASKRPRRLLDAGYVPAHRIRLFDTVFWLAKLREEPNARFFVTYVALAREPRRLYARFFYKDGSLIWRSASHFARSADENWIGKGDLKAVLEDDGEEYWYTAEETTNLPLELQDALEGLARASGKPVRDARAIELVLRRCPDRRIAPYRDFVIDRRRAAADPTNLVNGGRSIAWFTRKHLPESLRFARGYEPDFANGVLEVGYGTSRLYAGKLARYRILSANREVQYHFFTAPGLVWIVPPQTTTTELTSYGVRTVDVVTDDDLSVPGMEYHYLDESETPPRMYSQIPDGFAGPISTVDPARASAAPWLDRLPVIQAFRRQILEAVSKSMLRYGVANASSGSEC